MTDRRGPGLIVILSQQLCISCLSDYLSVGLNSLLHDHQSLHNLPLLSGQVITPLQLSVCLFIRLSSVCPFFMIHWISIMRPSICCCINTHALPCMILTIHRYVLPHQPYLSSLPTLSSVSHSLSLHVGTNPSRALPQKEKEKQKRTLLRELRHGVSGQFSNRLRLVCIWVMKPETESRRGGPKLAREAVKN